ncbi:MAG TPA: helix-turn-helix transcriptional regulator [Xanthobacteraceae bacterium]|nr:helix-turn-helix transcriptional regulator [Xanthobacteraceae bacterium]
MGAILAELSERDLRGAMAVLHSLAEASGNCRAFVAAALDQLTAVVPSDLTTLSLCDLARGTRRVIGRPGETLSDADRAAFDRHFREHPLVRFHGSHPRGPTQRISDCREAARFRDTPLYADYYRRLGVNYVMALPLRIDAGNVISVVFNRSRSDFRNGERALLDAIRRPLAALYRNLIVCEEAGRGLKCASELAAAGGWHMMRVTMAGRVIDASPAVLALLAHFFPRDGVGRGARLPQTLSDWFSHSRSWGLERPAVMGGEPFTAARQGAKLTVHFVPDPLDTAAGYLLVKSERCEVRAAHLGRLPITGREREILALVAAGKTNGEIGTILSISARTVQKHLEHIFQKLGVETRTAAAICALSAAGDHGLAA